MNKKPPLEGTMKRQVYDAVVEFPGVRVSALEVAIEVGGTSKMASTVLHNLYKEGRIKREGEGWARTNTIRWFVEAPNVQ